MLAGSRDIPLMRSGSWQVGTWQPSWASSLFLTGLEVLSARWLTLSTKPCKLSSVTLHFLFMALRLFFFLLFLLFNFQITIWNFWSSEIVPRIFFFRKFSNLNNYQFHHPIARDQFLIKIRYSILQNSTKHLCKKITTPDVAVNQKKKKLVHAYFYCYAWVCFFRRKRGRVLIPQLLATFISWGSNRWSARAPAAAALLLWQMSAAFDETLCVQPRRSEMLAFSTGLAKAPKIISPGVTISDPNKMFFLKKIMTGFCSMSVICASCSQKQPLLGLAAGTLRAFGPFLPYSPN